jgi:hypothetical protein
LNMTDFRLILLDHTTYAYCMFMTIYISHTGMEYSI